MPYGEHYRVVGKCRRASAFIQAGQTRAAEFSWERTARLTRDVYEAALAFADAKKPVVQSSSFSLLLPEEENLKIEL